MKSGVDKSVLEKITSFPVLPSVVQNIQKIAQSNDFSIYQIYDEIKKDAGILFEITKIGCSSLYNLPKKDIKYIISFLGINEVFKIVFMVSAVNAIKVEDQKALMGFWKHSYSTALWAKIISKKLKVINYIHDDLWLAAMLHDIGKLVYLKLFPGEYKEVENDKEKKQCLFSEVEKTDSATLGHYLGIRWNLPTYVLKSCQKHSIDYLTETQLKNVQEIVTLANLFANLQHEKLNETTKEKIYNALSLNLKWNKNEISSFLKENSDLINQELVKLLKKE